MFVAVADKRNWGEKWGSRREVVFGKRRRERWGKENWLGNWKCQFKRRKNSWVGGSRGNEQRGVVASEAPQLWQLCVCLTKSFLAVTFQFKDVTAEDLSQSTMMFFIAQLESACWGFSLSSSFSSSRPPPLLSPPSTSSCVSVSTEHCLDSAPSVF